MFKSFTISRPKPYLLIFRKSRAKYIVFLAFHVLFFSVWYTILINSGLKLTNSIGLLFYLSPLMTLPQVLHAIKVVMSGEVFIFDSDRKLVHKNDKRIADFDDISRLQLRTIPDPDGPDDHRLSIVFKDEKKVRIEQSTDYDEIANAADDIADILDVKIVRKK